MTASISGGSISGSVFSGSVSYRISPPASLPVEIYLESVPTGAVPDGSNELSSTQLGQGSTSASTLRQNAGSISSSVSLTARGVGLGFTPSGAADVYLTLYTVDNLANFVILATRKVGGFTFP
jgi:hypothetical protein